MNIKRRDFIKGSTAASVLLMSGIASVTAARSANTALDPDVEQIQKSIKASFGGGFSLRAHTQSGALTYADIEHFGNRYAVTSADMLDWRIVRAL